MSEATHNLLWKRVISALHGRSIGPAASQGALAAEARSKLGTDLVDQFLHGYFFERQYGGGNSQLSDEQAAALANYLGVMWGGQKPDVTAATVKALR